MTALPVVRHLDYGPSASVHDVGAAGVQAILDGSDVGGWRPVLAAVAREPWGPVATRVEQVLDHLETYGTAALIGGWLHRCRTGSPDQARTLAELRREVGLSQRELAARLGLSQAQVARVETSATPSMRSLTRYLQGLGATPVALIAGGRTVRLPTQPDDTAPPRGC